MFKRTLLGLAALAMSGAAMGEPLSKDAIILPGSALPGMLSQCSRPAPEQGETTWKPAPSDIASLEAALLPALRSKHAGPGADWTDFPGNWIRQYVGIVRKGRRFIYGNFAPRADYKGLDQPLIVCDGGPAFFGAEYDVEAGRFSHMAFNGSV